MLGQIVVLAIVVAAAVWFFVFHTPTPHVSAAADLPVVEQARTFQELAERLGLVVVEGDPHLAPGIEVDWTRLGDPARFHTVRCRGMRGDREVELVHHVDEREKGGATVVDRDCRLAIRVSSAAEVEIVHGVYAPHVRRRLLQPRARTGVPTTDQALEVRASDPGLVAALRSELAEVAERYTPHIVLEHGWLSIHEPARTGTLAFASESTIALLARMAARIESADVAATEMGALGTGGVGA